MRPFLYFLVHADLEDAVKKIRAAGADSRQLGQLVETVWSNVRVAAPDATDAALDAKCAATDVEEEISLLRGVGRPLILRPGVPGSGVALKPRLILRSRAKRGVSKDGQQHDWFPPFETRPCRPLLRVR